jgi:hypothetical protein
MGNNLKVDPLHHIRKLRLIVVEDGRRFAEEAPSRRARCDMPHDQQCGEEICHNRHH